MRFPARHLDCSNCGRLFPFTSEEQSLSHELGYERPKRCMVCRQALEDLRRVPSPAAPHNVGS
jgi:hypothetical protein